MKQLKTFISALFIVTAMTASAETTNETEAKTPPNGFYGQMPMYGNPGQMMGPYGRGPMYGYHRQMMGPYGHRPMHGYPGRMMGPYGPPPWVTQQQEQTQDDKK